MGAKKLLINLGFCIMGAAKLIIYAGDFGLEGITLAFEIPCAIHPTSVMSM